MHKKNEDWRNSPTAWFAVLERALRDGNFKRAAEATAELRRLGVGVTIAADLRTEAAR